MIKMQVICDKCNGRKVLHEYKHRHAGICYSCNGKGFVEVSESKYKEITEQQKKKTNRLVEIEKRIEEILDSPIKTKETQAELRGLQQELVNIISRKVRL